MSLVNRLMPNSPAPRESVAVPVASPSEYRTMVEYDNIPRLTITISPAQMRAIEVLPVEFETASARLNFWIDGKVMS